ncbi:hypothetical protein LSTR_LSTR016507 [Laodelphax striatellus]|uniref:Secreted protein n=1 Tax=Laodelphax striatellus TaxID=195883 RepID=A0A482WLK1_LAOST|nr:hypothetical protein LSTR_LSTR016507 [Laodelphax striatellus]
MDLLAVWAPFFALFKEVVVVFASADSRARPVADGTVATSLFRPFLLVPLGYKAEAENLFSLLSPSYTIQCNLPSSYIDRNRRNK